MTVDNPGVTGGVNFSTYYMGDNYMEKSLY